MCWFIKRAQYPCAVINEFRINEIVRLFLESFRSSLQHFVEPSQILNTKTACFIIINSILAKILPVSRTTIKKPNIDLAGLDLA